MTVSSFPEPQVMWHLISNKIVLRPGESAVNGETANNIKNVQQKILYQSSHREIHRWGRHYHWGKSVWDKAHHRSHKRGKYFVRKEFWQRMLFVSTTFNFQTDADLENSLHIKVRNTKNIKLPFKIEIEENIFPDVRYEWKSFCVLNSLAFSFLNTNLMQWWRDQLRDPTLLATMWHCILKLKALALTCGLSLVRCRLS